MTRRQKRTFLVGLLLFSLSLYTLLLIAREEWLQTAVYNRYDVEEAFLTQEGQFQYSQTPLSYVWHGQKVVLTDAFETGTYLTDARRGGPVRILINGHNYSSPYWVEIRPLDHDVNRYWMQLMVVKLKDKKLHTERLVILQSFPNYNLHEYYLMHSDKLRCRALLVTADGKVDEETFSFADRAWPRYRTVLANEVAPEQLGFYSDVLMIWPSLFYPVLYPFVTVVIGLWYTVKGGMQHRKAK